MDKKKAMTPSEWILRSIYELENISGSGKNTHFETFKCYRKETLKSLRGLSLLKCACSILSEVHFTIKSNLSEKKIFKPYVYIHLGYSENIQYWDNSIWLKLGQDSEKVTYQSPSLGIASVTASDFFGIDLEEYRCPIKFPPNFLLDSDNKILAIFRCFRTQQSLEKSWEFSTGIYLYYAGDF